MRKVELTRIKATSRELLTRQTRLLWVGVLPGSNRPLNTRLTLRNDASRERSKEKSARRRSRS